VKQALNEAASRSELEIEQVGKSVEDRTGALLEMIRKPVHPPTEPSARLKAGSGAPASDPQKGNFGGKAEANGRILAAKITVVKGTNDEFCLIHLEVRSSTSEKPLSSPVEFHLHPDFEPPVVSVKPVDGTASLDRFAWGAFTVGAVTDEGKTQLELDLEDLPEAPLIFKTR
jgi:hypothetical protein